MEEKGSTFVRQKSAFMAVHRLGDIQRVCGRYLPSQETARHHLSGALRRGFEFPKPMGLALSYRLTLSKKFANTSNVHEKWFRWLCRCEIRPRQIYVLVKIAKRDIVAKAGDAVASSLQ